jgi:hypothetical protein
MNQEMKDSIDFSLHAKACLKYFQLVINNFENDGIKTAVRVIYLGITHVTSVLTLLTLLL